MLPEYIARTPRKPMPSESSLKVIVVSTVTSQQKSNSLAVSGRNLLLATNLRSLNR